MPIREVPKRYFYVCDCCGNEEVRENAPYADQRPPRWARLKFIQGAEDYQGGEVADASIERLFCPGCRSKVVAAINSIKADQTEGAA